MSQSPGSQPKCIDITEKFSPCGSWILFAAEVLYCVLSTLLFLPYILIFWKDQREPFFFCWHKTLMNLEMYTFLHTFQCDICLLLNSHRFWLSLNLWHKTITEPFYRTILGLWSCKFLRNTILNFNAAEEEGRHKSCTLLKSYPWKSGWEVLQEFKLFSMHLIRPSVEVQVAKWKQNLAHFSTMDRRPGLLTNWNVQKKISDAFRGYKSYRNSETRLWNQIAIFLRSWYDTWRCSCLTSSSLVRL